MNQIFKVILFFLIPISLISQTQEDILNHYEEMASYHNKFMVKYIEYAKKSNIDDLNKLLSLSTLIEEHKKKLLKKKYRI